MYFFIISRSHAKNTLFFCNHTKWQTKKHALFQPRTPDNMSPFSMPQKQTTIHYFHFTNKPPKFFSRQLHTKTQTNQPHITYFTKLTNNDLFSPFKQSPTAQTNELWHQLQKSIKNILHFCQATNPTKKASPIQSEALIICSKLIFY